jgi:hypothetical protein
VFYIIDDMILLTNVKTCFQQIIVTSWALFFSVFRGIFPAIFRRFSKKLIWHWRRTACTGFFSWFQCTQTVFKINIIIYWWISLFEMNHEMYRDCVYNGLIYTIRRVKILILSVVYMLFINKEMRGCQRNIKKEVNKKTINNRKCC